MIFDRFPRQRGGGREGSSYPGGAGRAVAAA